MNKQIRHLGYFLVVLFLILFVQVNNIQVVQADKLSKDTRNNRTVVRDFSSARGNIQTVDGVVIANSVPTEGEYKFVRQYPKPDLYAHTTGFFSFTYGNEGLEKQYNDALTGRTFAITSLDDLLKERINTNNLTITINDKVQQAARNALGGYKGAVVAINPNDGGILAMYSNPSYDPSRLSGHDFKAVREAWQSLVNDGNNPMKPRGYRESYAPGSTFKGVTAAAAYDRGQGLTTKRYPTLQSLTPQGTRLPLRNFGGGTCGGPIDELLRVSCNTGFAQMGIDVGGQELASEAVDFGFNQTPPLDMPAVAKSRFPSPEYFRRNDPGLAYSAIGQQNVSATPLQMALVAAGVANKGLIMQPHLMKEIRNNHGDIVRRAGATPWRRATSTRTAQQLTANMVEVAANGTAVAAQVLGFPVAAKTGTAETRDGFVHAWLIAFAPADDPKIAVAVIVENQPGVSEATGGRIAAPIARQVMSAALGAS